jgi:hypothetical protein
MRASAGVELLADAASDHLDEQVEALIFVHLG